MHDDYLEIYNLVQGSFVFKKQCPGFKFKGIDLDGDSLILHGDEMPILVATLENEQNEIWRFFWQNKLLKDAL